MVKHAETRTGLGCLLSSLEYRFTGEQLGQNTADGPNIDGGALICQTCQRLL